MRNTAAVRMSDVSSLVCEVGVGNPSVGMGMVEGVSAGVGMVCGRRPRHGVVWELVLVPSLPGTSASVHDRLEHAFRSPQAADRPTAGHSKPASV